MKERDGALTRVRVQLEREHAIKACWLLYWHVEAVKSYCTVLITIHRII